MSRRYGLPGATLRLRRFRACDRGAAALEFGFIALPFFLLLFAILEIALIFWSTQVLESAVAAAARQIYTGRFQQDSNNATLTPAQLRAKFKTAVCEHVVAVFDCASRVQVDVRTFSTYASASAPTPVTNGAYDTSSYGYASPGPNQITIARASLEYPVYVNLLSSLGTLSNGNRLIMAAATFRTEPY